MTKSAPTASVEAYMANEASSNELASKLELAYMVSGSVTFRPGVPRSSA